MEWRRGIAGAGLAGTLVVLALAPPWAQGAEPGPAGPTRFTVAATGDLLIHTGVARQALANGGGTSYDFRPMFSSVRGRIAGADLALCHIETPLVPGPVRGYPSFRTPPALARSVRAAGWDACSTASNHSLDAGQYGVGTTLRALDRAGLRHAGTARSPREGRRVTILDVKGVRLALLSYTAVSNGQPVPHAWSLDLASPGLILADARRARRDGADAAIVNLHWGEEYRHAATPSQRSLAERLTRSRDIAAIVGQHAHVVQPIRFLHGKPVVFGEGNLISNQSPVVLRPRLPGRPRGSHRLRRARRSRVGEARALPAHPRAPSGLPRAARGPRLCVLVAHGGGGGSGAARPAGRVAGVRVEGRPVKFRRRYQVVVEGVSRQAAAQRAVISEHRSEQGAREAAALERSRLEVIHGGGARSWRILVMLDDQVVAEERPEAEGEDLLQAPRRAPAQAPGQPADVPAQVPAAPEAEERHDESSEASEPTSDPPEPSPEGPVPDWVIRRFEESIERRGDKEGGGPEEQEETASLTATLG